MIKKGKLHVYLLCLYLFTLFLFVYDEQLIKLSELVFLVFASITILNNIIRNKRIKFGNFYFAIFGLFFIGLLSYFWAIESNLVISNNKRLFQLFMLLVLVYVSLNDLEDVELCIKSIGLGGILMNLYSISFYGINSIIEALQYGYRLGSEINQTNSFGYYSVVSFFIIIYYANQTKKKSLLFLSILPLVLVIASGSRRSLLLLIIGALFMLFSNTIIKKNKIRAMFFTLVIIVILYPSIQLLIPTAAFYRFGTLLNFLTGQGHVDNSILVRQQMIDFGWQQFKRNPIVGHGTGQYSALYNQYFGVYRPSHNGYIQVLVEYGIMGFLIYYYMYVHIVKELWVIFKKRVSSISLILLILIGFRLVSDIAAYSFYDKFNYILLGMSFSFIRIVKNKL